MGLTRRQDYYYLFTRETMVPFELSTEEIETANDISPSVMANTMSSMGAHCCD